VAIGGGTGLPVVLSGLSSTLDGLTDRPDSLTAIVTVMDDGGSSGQLRRGLGIIPPGDIRNCLAALAANDLPLASVLQHRFGEDSILGGHPVGNILLAALLERTGSVESAVAELSRMLRLRGRVIPCSAADVHLRAVLRDGRTIIGETAIVDARQPIERLENVPPAQAGELDRPDQHIGDEDNSAADHQQAAPIFLAAVALGHGLNERPGDAENGGE